MIHYMEHDSPLGRLILAATGRGLCGLYFAEHKYFNGTQDWRHDAGQPHLQRTARQLDEYFARRRTSFDLPLDLDGTEFQRSVWQELTAIPFGRTASYAAVARQIGRPRAVRAVGAANGRNPVSIVVPCHRVVGTSGALTGYAAGLERKRYLLALEGLCPQ
jgi:methylated-DNA-[protein]-cysteine S-methyltransferase